MFSDRQPNDRILRIKGIIFIIAPENDAAFLLSNVIGKEIREFLVWKGLVIFFRKFTYNGIENWFNIECFHFFVGKSQPNDAIPDDIIQNRDVDFLGEADVLIVYF